MGKVSILRTLGYAGIFFFLCVYQRFNSMTAHHRRCTWLEWHLRDTPHMQGLSKSHAFLFLPSKFCHGLTFSFHDFCKKTQFIKQLVLTTYIVNDVYRKFRYTIRSLRISLSWHLKPCFFLCFFPSWLVIPRMPHFCCAVHIRIEAPHHTEGLVLQACHGSPDGSIHSISFPDFCACLFISVKVRVPQREVASCCFFASFPLGRSGLLSLLIAWLSLSLFFSTIWELEKKSSWIFLVKLVLPLFLRLFEVFSSKVCYAIQMNPVDFDESLLFTSVLNTFNQAAKTSKQLLLQSPV